MDNDENDSRELCKYGEKCYQKNPKHHERFKHPKKLEKKEEMKLPLSPPNKKRKEDNTEVESHVKATVSKIDNDEVLLPPSPEKIEDSIKQKFLVEMPKDFYDFWSFCSSLKKDSPQDALLSVGLKLVGPFDVLSGQLKAVKERRQNLFLCHWRYFYDPPELQTVIAGDDNEFHMGYYRDDPSENPVFVASMSSVKPGIVQPLKQDLFCSVYSHLQNSAPSSQDVKVLLSKLEKFAFLKGYKVKSTAVDSSTKARAKRVVSKTFHGAGIVVPVDKNTKVGYREIPETNADLKRILKKISETPEGELKQRLFEPLHELMTNAQWATDEGDFGMGLELGLDLFTFGSVDFHPFICHLLTVAYDLLDRKPFSQIIKAHLRDRRRGSDMSTF